MSVEQHREDWYASATGVAEFFGVARSTIWEWRHKGMPADGERFYMPTVIKWYFAFGPGRSEPARDDLLRRM